MPFFNDSYTFASHGYVLCNEVILNNVPPSFRMSKVPQNIECIRQNKMITLRKKEIPHIEIEPRQANIAMFNDTVFCSTVNFQEYCWQLKNLLNLAAKNSPLAAAKTKEITQNCKTVLEKITAIRDFADKNIRAAGPVLNEYNWKFSPADETLKRSYGNSADRAVLLKAMLNTAGLKSEYIVRSPLAFSLDSSNAFFGASLNYFQNDYNRILLLVYDKNKPIAILNENSRYAPVNQDNSPHSNSLNLDRRMPFNAKLNYPDNSTTWTMTFKIMPDLNVTADVQYIYKGTAAENMRKFFAESNSQQKKQFFEKSTTAFSRLATVKTPWQYQDNKNSITLKASFNVRGLLNISGNYASFELPWLNSLADNIPSSNDRKTPVWFNS